MANPEHLARLRKGREAWNRWRVEHPDLRPDLREADLVGANLVMANLAEADLFRAKLVGASLFLAIFAEANLMRADLTEANLAAANLVGANLARAKLVGAYLLGTELRLANLVMADLRRAEFHEAVLHQTVFSATDLREVKGLDSCKHDGPSIIDHRTIALSGPLPLAFLRGCGLPDVLIDNLPSLLNQPIQYYECFISHSTKDEEFAKRLHDDLQSRGARCWKASEGLKIGDPFHQRIDDAIRQHQKLLVILSEHSIQSAWVRDEVESCFEREHREKSLMLFPVRLDNAVMDTDAAWAASIRRQRHIGDFSKWKDHDSYQKAFDRLLNDLKAETDTTLQRSGPKARGAGNWA